MEQFQFAGFTFPRKIPSLPHGTPKQRAYMKRHQPELSFGTYYAAPKSGADGMSFYLDSDFMPGLRWQWADKVDGVRINHTGWFIDEDFDQTVRGIVMRLPKSRGFLAGWSMGESMASGVKYRVYDDETEAARAADEEARIVAEHEREYREEEEEEDDEVA